MYQSNNYILDMNNVVDYLEFKVQTCVRGHIINSSSAPCDYHKSNSVTFEHSVSDRCEFCYCSIWLSMIVQVSPEVFLCKLKEIKMQSLFRSGVNSLSIVFATAYSVLLERLTVIFIYIFF